MKVYFSWQCGAVNIKWLKVNAVDLSSFSPLQAHGYSASLSSPKSKTKCCWGLTCGVLATHPKEQPSALKSGQSFWYWLGLGVILPLENWTWGKICNFRAPKMRRLLVFLHFSTRWYNLQTRQSRLSEMTTPNCCQYVNVYLQRQQCLFSQEEDKKNRKEMEFIVREVKRSKKKKRLHAFPPDKPNFNSKGLYIFLNFLPYLTSVGYKTPSLRARNCGFVVIMVLVNGEY